MKWIMRWWTDVDMGIILYYGLYRPVTLVLDLEVKRQGIVSWLAVHLC
jgi:hypothetical protein